MEVNSGREGCVDMIFRGSDGIITHTALARWLGEKLIDNPSVSPETFWLAATAARMGNGECLVRNIPLDYAYTLTDIVTEFADRSEASVIAMNDALETIDDCSEGVVFALSVDRAYALKSRGLATQLAMGLEALGFAELDGIPDDMPDA